MVNEKRGTLQVIAVANFIIAALFVVFSLPFFWRQVRVLTTWPTVDGQVLSSEVVSHGSGHEQLYGARIRLLLTVDSKPVTAELIGMESRNYEATWAHVAQYAVGSHHPIRYDPHDPSQVRLAAGWNSRFFALPLIVFGAGVAFALVGLFFSALPGKITT